MEKTAFEKLAELQMEKTAYKYLKRLQKKVLRFGPDSEKGKEALDELRRLSGQIMRRYNENPSLGRLSNKMKDRHSFENQAYTRRRLADVGARSRYSGRNREGDYEFVLRPGGGGSGRYMQHDSIEPYGDANTEIKRKTRASQRKRREDELMEDYIPNIFGDGDFDDVKEYNKELAKRKRKARISRRKEKRDKKRQFDDRGRQLADTGVYLNFAQKRNLPHDVGSPLARVPEGLGRMEHRLRGLQSDQFDARHTGEQSILDLDKDRIEAMKNYDYQNTMPLDYGDVTPGAVLAERVRAQQPSSEYMKGSPYYNRKPKYGDPKEELADQETIDLFTTDPVIEQMEKKIKQPEIPTLSEPTRTVGGDVAKKKRGNLALGLGIPALAGGAYLYSKKKKKSRKEKDQMKAAGLYDHLTK